jgi:hypothetical protein
MTKLPSLFGLSTVLALIAATPACSVVSPDAASSAEEVNEGASTLSLLQDLPLDTKWEDVPANVRAALAKNAERTRKAYEDRSSEEALRAQIAVLEDGESADATKAFDAFVRGVYGAFLADADGYAASKSMNPKLRSALQKLYVARIAAWRLNVKNYGNMEALEADGTTPIDEFPLPSERAMEAYEAIAKEATSDLRAAAKGSLTAEEKALAERAAHHARSHAVGSTGFRYGAEDLLTVWGRGGWAYDLVYARSSNGGSFMQDDAKYADVVNAYYDAPTTHVDKGTVHALGNLVDMLVDPEFLAGEFGSGPAENPAAKAYLLLTRWWIERTKGGEDAENACSVYASRDKMWEGFTADNLFNADGATSLTDFKADAGKEFAALLTRYKTSLGDAAKAFGQEKGLTSTQVSGVSSAINAASTFGAVTDAAALAFDRAGAGLGARFKTKLADVPALGGYEEGQELRKSDADAVNRIYSDVKSFLQTTYGLDVTKLPAKVVIKADSTSTFTGQDGVINIGLATKRGEDYWYRVMLHEAHHAFNQVNGVFVEGAGWEGAADTTEFHAFPALMKASLAAHGLEAKAPYYIASNYGNGNAFAAKTEATLDVLLAGSCGGGKDTIERTEDIARRWGLTDPKLIDDVVVRSHHGTSYLQYTAGRIVYGAFLTKLSTAVGQPVDAFHLQACKLTFAPDNAATVTALKTCLAAR